MTMPTSKRLNMDSPRATHLPDSTPWREIPPFQRIDSSLRQVSRLICQSFDPRGAPKDLVSLIDHLKGGGGKMLRPGMVLLAGECFGPLTEKHIQVSAMVEMIHHATLLHDDVIDDGSKRRGVPTINSLWGNESAVLLGDFLLSHVFRMASDLDPAVAKMLAQTAVRVCEGELRQTVQKRNWWLSEDQYLEIITEKSASFFSGCCRLGAMLSRASEEQIESLARFGLLAGIAFQITDDLLDIAGDENRTGKTSQSDLAKDKPTLAVIHLLRTIDSGHQADLYAALGSPDKSRHELVDVLERHGSLRYARAQAADYVQKATRELETVPAGQAKDALVETARFMADRMA
jgi:geranylgeranyl pyrophosphate synthase